MKRCFLIFGQAFVCTHGIRPKGEPDAVTTRSAACGFIARTAGRDGPSSLSGCF